MMFANLRTPLSEWQKELDAFLNLPYTKRTVGFPLVNVVGKEDRVMVSAEIPGVSPDKIDITVHQATLTIKGNREQEITGKIKVRERNFGKFERHIKLPFKADLEKVSAEYANGVLYVSLQQVAEAKPKKIEIKS